jgi:hypothetical protein
MEMTANHWHTTHRIRRGDNFYEVETTRKNGEYLATWWCQLCQASRDLQAKLYDEAEEQAFASIDAHQLFFHSRRGGESVQVGHDAAMAPPKPR